MSSQVKQTFVVEVGVEEIPSRYVADLAEGFGAAMQRGLDAERLPYEDPVAAWTPRRLIFQARVASVQSAESEEVRGPAVAVAYRDGAASPALEGFLRRVGKAEHELGRADIGGKEYVVATVEKPVDTAATVLPRLVAGALAGLPQPRSMRWRSDDARFIRPVRWLTMLLDDQVLAGEALGVAAGDVTYGNRTDHPEAMRVTAAQAYWSALSGGMVVADPAQRRQIIVDEANRLAEEAGGRVDWDDDLLDEVTNLVEWPTPFLGRFEEEFLEVPEPVLTTAMRVHQRYFPVRAANGRLMAAFIAVRNGAGEELDLVRRGNQKVLRARLSDARYFFQLDQKQRLADHQAALAGVTLHAKLGTFADKVGRLQAVFQDTRDWWGLTAEEAGWLERSAALYKCDLLTHVVAEFPELQGEMGGIYAARDGEAEEVAIAIRDQYRPGFPGDRVPDRPVAAILGLLDRADTLVSFYGAGIRATGSEDPFGLRRVALGLARIAAETSVLREHTVRDLLQAVARVNGADQETVDPVYQLVSSRLMSEWELRWDPAWLLAVLARDFSWTQLADRLEFIAARHGSPAFDEASQAYKRVARMSRDVSDAVLGDTYTGIEADLKQAADRAMAVPDGDLAGWWQAIEALVPRVQQFFEDVLVMDPDPSVRRGRLGLLAYVQSALGRYVAWEHL